MLESSLPSQSAVAPVPVPVLSLHLSKLSKLLSEPLSHLAWPSRSSFQFLVSSAFDTLIEVDNFIGKLSGEISFATSGSMYSDDSAAVEPNSSRGEESAPCEGEATLEPCEGMEFASEDAAKIFYDEYARRLGFVMRVMSCRRSERDGKIIARRLGCNKEGYRVNKRDKAGAIRKPKPITREGCKAMIYLKFNKSGKWVVAKFEREHNHPLVVSPREARHTTDEKDRKIQELTLELRNKRRLCAAYKEQLTAFLKIVEEHSEQISMKVQNVMNNIKEYECVQQEIQRTGNLGI